MSAYYLSQDEIIDAVMRANDGTPQDGTYVLQGFWIGNRHGINAIRIAAMAGYEVAYEPLFEKPTDLAFVAMETDRIGIWFDHVEGKVCIDRTIHVNAPGGVALDIARMYNQKAIWSWHDTEVIETTDPATGIDQI